MLGEQWVSEEEEAVCSQAPEVLLSPFPPGPVTPPGVPRVPQHSPPASVQLPKEGISQFLCLLSPG